MLQVEVSINLLVISNFINIGANVNSRDKDGNTPLILTAMYCDPSKWDCFKTAEILIKNGADVNAVNNIRKNALCQAKQNNQSVDFINLIQAKTNFSARICL